MAEADKKTGKPSGTKKIIDVAHPGESAPSGNSKSVIVNSRPLLKDPMVNEPEADNAAKMPDKEPAKETAEPEFKSKPEAELKPKPEKTVKPPADTASADEPDTAEPDTEQATEPDDKATDGNTDDEDSKPETADDEKQAADKGKDPAKQLEAEAVAEAEHQATIAKLVGSKQYYLPINTVEKRKAKRFVVIGILLAVILVLAWADIALDAGLIHVHGIKPVTHLFSN